MEWMIVLPYSLLRLDRPTASPAWHTCRIRSNSSTIPSHRRRYSSIGTLNRASPPARAG